MTAKAGISTNKAGAMRYRRMALWSFVFIVLAALVLPLTGYVYVGIQEARAQAQATDQSNPRANYWRAVRGGNAGYSAVTGQKLDGTVANAETNMLINSDGQNWRQLRVGVLANWGGWILFLVVIALMLFFAFRGRLELAEGRSGRRVKRWSTAERVLHWYTAILFIILAVTGLSLLFGRVLLIPLLGLDGFSVWADLSTGLHNYAGPLFAIGVILMIVFWVGHNIPTATDFKWFAKGGGFGKAHPSAGRLNGGEKVWFWFIVVVGGAVVATGFILDFPETWGQTRNGMQLSSLVHGAAALAWICMWLGHAYIGSIGSEGSLEAMTTGYVDENWAKQHHDEWHETVKGEVEPAPQPQPPSPSGAPGQPA